MIPLGLVATIAVVWAGAFVFGLPFVLGLCRAAGRRTPVPPARRWVPDAAAVEDAEVAALDEIWELPASGEWGKI